MSGSARSFAERRRPWRWCVVQTGRREKYMKPRLAGGRLQWEPDHFPCDRDPRTRRHCLVSSGNNRGAYPPLTRAHKTNAGLLVQLTSLTTSRLRVSPASTMGRVRMTSTPPAIGPRPSARASPSAFCPCHVAPPMRSHHGKTAGHPATLDMHENTQDTSPQCPRASHTVHGGTIILSHLHRSYKLMRPSLCIHPCFLCVRDLYTPACR